MCGSSSDLVLSLGMSCGPKNLFLGFGWQKCRLIVPDRGLSSESENFSAGVFSNKIFRLQGVMLKVSRAN